MKEKKILSSALTKWIHHTGLGWWDVKIIYHKGKDAHKYFKSGKNETIMARIFSDWRYGELVIHFNIQKLKGKNKEEIDRIVVHELCHALVNEMREDGIDHEERVVTGLTKAFLWVDKFAHEE